MLLTNPVENPGRHTPLDRLKQAERNVEREEVLHILPLVRESPVRMVRGAYGDNGSSGRSCQPQEIGWDKGDESENVSSDQMSGASDLDRGPGMNASFLARLPAWPPSVTR